MRIAAFLIAGLLTVALLAGMPVQNVQAQSAAPGLGRDLKDIIARAAREGSLDLSWSASVIGDADIARQHMDQFNKMYGLHLTHRFSAGPSMAQQGNQLFTEFSARQPASSDLLFSSAQSLMPLLPHDMFYIVPWVALSTKSKLPPEAVEAGGRIVRVGTSIPVVVYNTNLMPHPPATVQALLAPQWRGKLATPPNASGFDVLSANDFWGQQRATDYVRSLAGLGAGLVRCGDDDRIASGEYAAFIFDCSSQGARMLHEKGAPVDYFIAKDAAQIRYYYMAIPKNARHPNASLLFILYLLSPAGEDLFYKTMRMDLDFLPGSKTAQFIDGYRKAGVKFTTVTARWWAIHPEALEGQKREVEILSTSK
jgi:iron(III) transport system substrate-binding protein